MSDEVESILLWTAIFLLVGVFVATARKTLSNISRKSLLDRLPITEQERFQGYLDSLARYGAALRFADQGLRMALVACAVFAFKSLDYQLSFFSVIGLVAAVFATFMLFLELMPAIVARISPERLLIPMLPLLKGLYHAIKFPLTFFEVLVNVGARALGSQPARDAADVVEEGILTAAEKGEREGILEKSEISMIESIIEFSDRNVSEILTPRTEMVAIDADLALGELVRKALECGHSRLPVYRGNLDKILGLLYVKDLLKFFNEGEQRVTALEDILRKPHYVPEAKKVRELFQEFKTQRFHIALVMDEFGGTSGLVTIEDIIEEIIGEIEQEDEHHGGDESRVERIVRLGKDLVEVDAHLSVHELNRELRDGSNGRALAIPQGNGFETVGGFVSSSMGRIPAVGDTFEHELFVFEVLDADERTLRRLRIRIRHESESPEGGARHSDRRA